MTPISSLNTGLTLPADVSGYTLPTGALIPISDPGDTQESSVGTTKAVPVLRILDRAVSLQGGFNATTSTPNLQNSTGSSGNFYHVTVSGEHNLGDGTEFFAVGWDLLHNGTSYVKYYNIKNFNELNEGLTSPADTYGFVAESGDLFPFTDINDTEFDPSGTQKSVSFRNLSENVLQYGMVTINEQRTSPGDAVGFNPDASDIILLLDVNDTQYSSSGTVKGLPVGSLPSGGAASTSGVELALFNPHTDTPNLTHTAGNIGDMFHVISSGGHDFGRGVEYLASGWDVLHDGRRFNTYRHLNDQNIITPLMFGASGDGIIDDTVAVQDAADFCWAIATGGSELSGIRPVLYFPPAVGYRTTSQVTVRRHIDVKMDSYMLYAGNHSSMALSIGESGLTNRDLDFKIRVFRPVLSDWTSEGSIGVRFINSDACRISVNSRGFTIGVQCIGWGAGFTHNDVTFGRVIDTKYHLDCTNNTAFGVAGWCNENTFRNGRFSNSSNTKIGQSRYGTRISSIDGANLSNNHNVYFRISNELNNASSAPADSVPYLIEAGSQMKIISNRSEGNGNILAIVASGSSDNEFEFQHQANGVIVESGAQEGSSRLFHAEDVTSRDVRLIFNSDFIGNTAVAYNSTQIHIPKCNIYNNTTRQTGVISDSNIKVFETDAFIADIFTDEILVDHNRHNGDIIYITGSDLPLGLTEDTKYFIVGVTGNERFQVSTTLNGSAVDITDSGTGRQVYFGRKGWVQYASNKAVGVRVATDKCKNFIVERNIFPNSKGSGGRVSVTPYDASGWVLGDQPDSQYVKGTLGLFWTAGSFGGAYHTSTDNEVDVHINLRDEVKSADIRVAGGSDNVALRQFKIYSVDLGTAPHVWTNYETSWEGQRFAAAIPTTGVYEAPITLWNAVPGGGQPMGWVCTTGGAPGIWATMPNLT